MLPSDPHEFFCLSEPIFVRLTGVDHPSFGRLEVRKSGGDWGTVCVNKWDNNDAMVVCRMLNFQKVNQTGSVGVSIPGHGAIWLDNVQCNGTESSLADCLHGGWNVSSCNH
ncbi:predicted protein, partial [Nematostella vectensis]